MRFDRTTLPEASGIYKFFSKNKIIYIGKAKNLKQRVSSYFGNSHKDRKTSQIKILTDRIETFITTSEAEALLLEQSLIKENLPRFNILLRDDKTYPYIHFSMEHEFPSISMKRSKHAVSNFFFGPFISVHAVKSTIKDLQKIYQIRNCNDSTFKNRSRPCIEHQMNRCSAPCVGLIGEIAYKTDISSSQKYLSSTGKKSKSLMVSQMRKLAGVQEFERANQIKKRIQTLDLLQQEKSFNSSLVSVDIFACVFELERTGICIISVRDGKIRGTKTHYLRDSHTHNVDSLFQSVIFSYYQNTFSLPDKIIITTKLSNLPLIKNALKLKFNKNIPISSNITQDVKNVVNLAKLNAKQVIENRVNQSDKYSYAIKDLLSYVGMKTEQFLIEGFDISHHGGSNAVASMVVFSNSGPQKSKYRLFNIPSNFSGNDAASIKHVLKRRINQSNDNPLPNIILIDGGKQQLNIALNIFSEMEPKPPLILSIVKGSKRVRATETILSKKGILEMSKDSPGFNLLQQVRDESHRFAITSNRAKKNKGIKYSSLDRINGVGPKKKKKLLNHFKSLQRIKAASKEELCKIDGINIKLAECIKNTL
jgi:excinuclease ABC subunit C